NNASTWYDRTNYFETMPAKGENLAWALEMEADRMINANIAQADLDKEFSVVRNEFEIGENQPDGVLSERMWSTAYLWHNYGKSPAWSITCRPRPMPTSPASMRSTTSSPTSRRAGSTSRWSSPGWPPRCARSCCRSTIRACSS